MANLADPMRGAVSTPELLANGIENLQCMGVHVRLGVGAVRCSYSALMGLCYRHMSHDIRRNQTGAAGR